MAIDYEVRDQIAYISFCRPDKHNALRDEDIADLARAVIRFDRDDSAEVAIVFGPGKSFSSGGDVKSRLQASVDEGNNDDRTDESDAFHKCKNWKPMIAAVHGYCLGHALASALHCDMVVAARNTVFQATEIVVGIPSSGIWPHMAAKPMLANELCLTGRFFGVDEAWETGMLTKVVDDGTHVAAAEEIARQIMKNPKAAVREQVRMRRALVRERSAHMHSMMGGFRWLADTESRDMIAQKMNKQ